MPTEFFANWSLVFLRASGMLTAFPVFSAVGVPVQVRVALGALLAFLVSPELPPVEWGGSSLWMVVGQMAKEIGVGLLLGFLCRLIFHTVEMAGMLISAEIGLSMPSSFNPMIASQSTVPGAILGQLATVIWLSLDLHHWLLVGFQRTYGLLPVGGATLPPALLNEVVAWIGRMFLVGLQIAAPVMAVSFLISLVFSVLGRAVSQMNVFTESFAIRLFSGLALFGVATQLMARYIVNYLHHLPEDVLRVARLMGG